MQVIRLDTARRGQVRRFVGLPFDLYRDCPAWCPPLRRDEAHALDAIVFNETEAKEDRILLDLEKATVEDIMIPRSEVDGIDFDEPVEDILTFLRRTQYTRIPVWEGSIDNVVGVLHVRDFMQAQMDEAEITKEVLRGLLRDPYFVPEGKKLIDLLNEFRTNRPKLAIIIDDAGYDLDDLQPFLDLALPLAVAVLPNTVKRPLYRLVFGYHLGLGVRIGLALLDAEDVVLGEGTRIGHFTVITGTRRVTTGRDVRIGWANVVRGGACVNLGDYAEILRLNVLNAIPDHDCTTEPQSVLEVGAGTVITSGHRIDFTDRVTLGKNVIIGGRNSSLWTHNRQETAPIEIGDFCYLGSEVRLAPGAKLPDECILGLGSVLTGEIKEPRSLVAGVPAKVVRPMSEKDLAHVRRKTRKDMPDDYYERS